MASVLSAEVGHRWMSAGCLLEEQGVNFQSGFTASVSMSSQTFAGGASLLFHYLLKKLRVGLKLGKTIRSTLTRLLVTLFSQLQPQKSKMSFCKTQISSATDTESYIFLPPGYGAS